MGHYGFLYFLANRCSSSISRYWVPLSALTEGAIPSDARRKSVSANVNADISDLFIISPKTNQIGTVQALIATSGPLSGYVKFNFGDLDEWLEEQAVMQFHPRDPYHRVDILPTSRKIRVEIDGIVLADTTEEGGVMSLWETHFPGRWYLPRTTVRSVSFDIGFLTYSTILTGQLGVLGAIGDQDRMSI